VFDINAAFYRPFLQCSDDRTASV